MTPAPDDPTPAPSGARLRARARVGAPRIRPEVADALGGLERSLVDVATWERLQPSPVTGEPDLPSAVAAPAEEPADDEPADVDEVTEAQAEIPPPPDAPGSPPPGIPPPPGAPAILPPELIVDLEPAVHPAASATTASDDPLLSRFVDDATLDSLRITGPLLPGATPIPARAPQVDADSEEAQRRRRNGKVLSWAGVVLLAAVAALWLVPDRSPDADEQLPAVDEQSSTTEDSLLLDPSELTTTTAPITTTTEAAVVTAPTTNTTVRSTKKATTTTTTRPPATTTPPTTPTTKFTPSSIRTVPGPPVTTTVPATTTTTLAP